MQGFLQVACACRADFSATGWSAAPLHRGSRAPRCCPHASCARFRDVCSWLALPRSVSAHSPAQGKQLPDQLIWREISRTAERRRPRRLKRRFVPSLIRLYSGWSALFQDGIQLRVCSSRLARVCLGEPFAQVCLSDLPRACHWRLPFRSFALLAWGGRWRSRGRQPGEELSVFFSQIPRSGLGSCLHTLRLTLRLLASSRTLAPSPVRSVGCVSSACCHRLPACGQPLRKTPAGGAPHLKPSDGGIQSLLGSSSYLANGASRTADQACARGAIW